MLASQSILSVYVILDTSNIACMRAFFFPPFENASCVQCVVASWVSVPTLRRSVSLPARYEQRCVYLRFLTRASRLHAARAKRDHAIWCTTGAPAPPHHRSGLRGWCGLYVRLDAGGTRPLRTAVAPSSPRTLCRSTTLEPRPGWSEAW